MRTKAELTELFGKLGLADPEGWANAELEENLGNLPKAAFLRQAWRGIPGSADVGWLDRWSANARRQPGDAHVVAAYERLLAQGAKPEDLTLLVRYFMAEFLFEVAYLLDDPSIEDETLAAAVGWGLYEESEVYHPLRRMGCMHELTYELDPERNDSKRQGI